MAEALAASSDVLSKKPPAIGGKDSYAGELQGYVDQASEIEKKRAGLGDAPQLQPVPSPNVQVTDPKQVWGSAAMMLALVGSLMTRRPLVTAMNAAAGVLKSTREGDQEAMDAAYQTYKISSENALKIHNAELETYKAMEEKYKDDESAMFAHMRAAAAAHNDPIMLKIAEDRDAQGFEHLMLERERVGRELGRGVDLVEQEKNVHQAVTDLKNSPDYQKANAFTKAQMMAKLLRETSTKYAGESDKIDAAIKKVSTKLKPEIDKFDSAIAEIDQATTMLNADPWLAGVVGKARRYGMEPVIGLLDPRQKAPSQKFVSLMTTIQRDIQTLKNKSHYMSKGAIEALDDQVEGLGVFDTAQGALDSLDLARSTLYEERNGLQDVIDSAGDKAAQAADGEDTQGPSDTDTGVDDWSGWGQSP